MTPLEIMLLRLIITLPIFQEMILLRFKNVKNRNDSINWQLHPFHLFNFILLGLLTKEIVSITPRHLDNIFQLESYDMQCWTPNFFWVGQTTFLAPQSSIDQVLCISIIIFVKCKVDSMVSMIIIESCDASIQLILPGVVNILMDKHQKNEKDCKDYKTYQSIQTQIQSKIIKGINQDQNDDI